VPFVDGPPMYVKPSTDLKGQNKAYVTNIQSPETFFDKNTNQIAGALVGLRDQF
jgi:hypothetical protein